MKSKLLSVFTLRAYNNRFIMGKGIPDRWLPYKSVGDRIPGTKFISFKVPLKERLCYDLPEGERFTLNILVETVNNLGLIIDLTNTNRYYNSEELKKWDIQYKKIYCEGKKVPNRKVIETFFSTVDNFLANNAENSKLIGVHCTHGLNRTGYLVCRYMIEKLGIEPVDAISRFGSARGHPMERDSYIVALKEGTPKLDSGSDLITEPDLNQRRRSFRFPNHPEASAFPGPGISGTFQEDYDRNQYQPQPHMPHAKTRNRYRNYNHYQHNQPLHPSRYSELFQGPRHMSFEDHGEVTSFLPHFHPRDQASGHRTGRPQRQRSAYDYRPWERPSK